MLLAVILVLVVGTIRLMDGSANNDEAEVLPVVGAEDADLEYLGHMCGLGRRGLVLGEPRKPVAIKHPLNFQQFGTG